MVKRAEVIIVGAGHAGCEAALAAARCGARVTVVVMSRSQIGRLSCNPAMGGLAKGCLVREIDALGGAIGVVTDRAAIQFRRLNTRKGLAVQATRAQVDIALYPREMSLVVHGNPDITVVEAEVVHVRTSDARVEGVQLADGTLLRGDAVVLTTGTFLAGILHRGQDRTEGGRIGEGAAHRLSHSLRDLGLRVGRLKTGTTPRLDGRTVDWRRLELQGDVLPDARFSFGPRQPSAGAVDCFIGHTSEATHDIIRSDLDRSPLFTGAISGTGPRYCPSIEDKVVRFAERSRHQLFLEPEGLTTHRVYLNGASTSLPADTQARFVHSIVGLEAAEIEQFGYAVEYDFVDPRQLGHDLQCREIAGLYLAGQINGTSGYEEAAAQGFMAGVNAAREEPFVLGREEAMIGVLVDDLVTRGVGEEPYRMFPSRAEHRLLLREDNADRRLVRRGRAIGLVDDERFALFESKVTAIETARLALPQRFTPRESDTRRLAEAGIEPVRGPTTVEELLRRPEVDAAMLAPLVPAWSGLDEEVLQAIEVDVKYSGYLALAADRRDLAVKLGAVSLASIDFASVASLSTEVRERLSRARPADLGAATRIPGVTPAAVEALVVLLAARAG